MNFTVLPCSLRFTFYAIIETGFNRALSSPKQSVPGLKLDTFLNVLHTVEILLSFTKVCGLGKGK